jgi:hypothetical protein
VTTPQEEGFEFELDLEHDLGITRTPGSGNQWHSKLDLAGKSFRVSAKSSRSKVVVDDDLINEGLSGCDDGSIPLWAFRVPSGDFIMMQKSDFLGFAKGEIELTFQVREKRKERMVRADTPVLLRDN